jgi:hypothetical protein
MRGIIVTVNRDESWAAMVAIADRLSAQYCKGDTLKVSAQRRGTGLLTVAEGLLAWDKWTDVFEPIRQRRILSHRWRSIQSDEQAADAIEGFLRERPDLDGCDYCRDQANRNYHLEQIGTRPKQSDLLKRCPKCGALWECPAFGRADRVVSVGQARKRYPDANLPNP